MDIASEERTKSAYLPEIWSLCTTLSSEAIDAAEQRAKANNFNVDRGEVTFAELGINLASARDVLTDAIEKKKLIQLPITVQKDLLANLQAINKSLQEIMNNADGVVNLGDAVEVLNTSIWKYGLHNLSDQVLGYQVKLNQLKQYEVQIERLLHTLETGSVNSAQISKLAEEASEHNTQIQDARSAIDQEVASSAAARQQAQEELGKASAATAAALLGEAQVAQYASNAKASAAEIAPLETSIKSFFSEVDTYRKQIAASTDEVSKFLVTANTSAAQSLSENSAKITAEVERWNSSAKAISETQALALATQLADEKTAHAAFTARADKHLEELESGLKSRSEETIGKNKEQVSDLVQELAALKESVKEQITQATGLGQFGAFQSRMNTISATKYYWVAAIGILVAIVVCLTLYIALHAQQGDLHSAAFWIKISMNVPLGFLISFCTVQYNRERRLEEEYAFKASISVSLNPYKDLIYSILEKEGGISDGTYARFVIDAVTNVFTSPTEKIFDSPKKFEGVSEKSLHTAAELIGTAVKATK